MDRGIMKYSGRVLKGSMTVEMSFLMPIILLLIMSSILASFYFHDKNILAGAAYETAVAGSTKMREKDKVTEGELKSLFRERAGKKCILFAGQHRKVRNLYKSLCPQRAVWVVCYKKGGSYGPGESYPGCQEGKGDCRWSERSQLRRQRSITRITR